MQGDLAPKIDPVVLLDYGLGKGDLNGQENKYSGAGCSSIHNSGDYSLEIVLKKLEISKHTIWI